MELRHRVEHLAAARWVGVRGVQVQAGDRAVGVEVEVGRGQVERPEVLVQRAVVLAARVGGVPARVGADSAARI